MDPKLLLPIAATGFSVAFFHAAIPTHWLPFVMASRAQKWTRPKTLAITALAGLGHILFTTLLGVIIVLLGIVLGDRIGQLFPVVAGGALISFGAYYLIQQARGHKHAHVHFGFRTYNPDTRLSSRAPAKLAPAAVKFTAADLKPVNSDRVAIMSLLALLTFSPCEGFLPVYLSGIAYGWMGFIILSSILAVATLTGMLLLTWLTLTGLERMNLKWLERYESLLMGVLLIALGIGVMALEK